MTNSSLRVFIFGGTSEGREFTLALARRAAQSSVPCCLRVYTATEYGGAALDSVLHVVKDCGVAAKTLTGRLDGAALCAEFKQYGPGIVVDCTHPYALEISKNLQTAAAQTGMAYIRLKRPETELAPGTEAVWAASLSEAAAWLERREGNILLTTGSKELAPFARASFSGRVFARVLPIEQSLAQCRAYGFSPARIIAMQGPFSEAMNIALLQEINAAYLVTKESGKAGGFAEKISAAAKTGTRAVIIRRPQNADAGLDVEPALEAALHLMQNSNWLRQS